MKMWASRQPTALNLWARQGLRTAYHRHKTAPYRKAAKLQQKSAKANARLAYRQALSDHPELKKHAIARIWQKQKLKRQYAKAAREAGKQAKNAAVATERVSVGIVHAVKRHPVICLVLLLLLLVIFPDHIPVFHVLQYRDRRFGKSGCFYLSCR